MCTLTFASQVKQTLESAGYHFFKCSDGWWNFSEGSTSCTDIICNDRSLGNLLRKLAIEFGIS